MNFLPTKWRSKNELPSELTLILTQNSSPTKIPKQYRQIEIIEGRAWITTENSPYDHVLGSGESFEIKTAKHTLIESKDQAIIRLSL